MPGPGDPQTWPASTTHPNDPRASDTLDAYRERAQETMEDSPGVSYCRQPGCPESAACDDCVDVLAEDLALAEAESAEEMRAERIAEDRELDALDGW